MHFPHSCYAELPLDHGPELWQYRVIGAIWRRRNPKGFIMQINVNGTTLTITIDVSPESLARAPLSRSGKAKLVASTGGFVSVPGAPVKLGLNLITSR